MDSANRRDYNYYSMAANCTGDNNLSSVFEDDDNLIILSPPDGGSYHREFRVCK